MTPILGAIPWGGDFHVPPLEDLFEWPAFWFSQGWAIGPISLAMNRVVMLVLLAVLAASALFLIAFRAPKVVPGRLQASAEAIVSFVRDQIAIDAIGKEGVAFVPFLTTLFMFVFFNNLLEITPFVNFPPSSRMAIPAFLAILVWVIFIAVGIRSQGALRYFKDALFPPGVPKALYILIAPIEFISTFIVRPLTLSVRLFANLLAGHIILTIIFIAAHAFLHPARGLLAGVGLVALAAAPVLIAFELLVSVLQAYIFTILAAVYIGGALHPEH